MLTICSVCKILIEEDEPTYVLPTLKGDKPVCQDCFSKEVNIDIRESVENKEIVNATEYK